MFPQEEPIASAFLSACPARLEGLKPCGNPAMHFLEQEGRGSTEDIRGKA